MIVNVDNSAGFCFGVANAVKYAESELKPIESENQKKLYCLGDIVHNQNEIERLEKIGLEVVEYATFKKLKNCKVLIRAHGEPPSTYEIAKKNNIEIIDASCPIVLKLQEKIKESYTDISKNKGQIVIFGNAQHAEVVGLKGQTKNNAIVVERVADIRNIDFTKPISLFAQTTKSLDEYNHLAKILQEKSKSKFVFIDSICRKVSNRVDILKQFAKENDVIVFVSGKNSSNGNYLFSIIKKENSKSYFISDLDEIKNEWFSNAKSIGVSGATSTPKWLIDNVVDQCACLKKF